MSRRGGQCCVGPTTWTAGEDPAPPGPPGATPTWVDLVSTLALWCLRVAHRESDGRPLRKGAWCCRLAAVIVTPGFWGRVPRRSPHHHRPGLGRGTRLRLE